MIKVLLFNNESRKGATMLTQVAQVFVAEDSTMPWHTQYSLGGDPLKICRASGITEPLDVCLFPTAGDGASLNVRTGALVEVLRGNLVAINTFNRYLYFEPVAATRSNILSLWLANGEIDFLDLRLDVVLPQGAVVELKSAVKNHAFRFCSDGNIVTFSINNTTDS